ncbi:MAG: tyrosine-type recombinase/integrase [Planctomycetes bacterium]|nr:tyrosine-type recombinase/integrase [Planctomycetota bacterium]
MRLYRANWKDPEGQRVYSTNWMVEVRTPSSGRRRIGAFRDKRASEEFGRKLEALCDLRLAGQRPDSALLAWLDTLPSDTLAKLSRHGFIDGERAASAKGLPGHVADYRAALAAKGGCEQHVRQDGNKLVRLFEGCGFALLSDLDAGRVQQWLADRRSEGMGAATSNSYLVAAKAFCNWAVKNRRLPEHPLRHLAKVNAKVDVRKKRRPLSPEELARLLAAAGASVRLFRDMTGRDRAMVYRMASETGLRWSELRSLRRASFDLVGIPATVVLDAADEKAGRGAVLPLRPELADALRDYFVDHPALPSAPAFPMPIDDCGAEMLRRDLFETGDSPAVAAEKKARGETVVPAIPYRAAAGREADFHALRHTFGTWLAKGGVHPKVAQDLMGYSTINLTMGLYTHITLQDHAAALQNLPALPRPAQAANSAVDTMA